MVIIIISLSPMQELILPEKIKRMIIDIMLQSLSCLLNGETPISPFHTHGVEEISVKIGVHLLQ
jgi:hypothetical protein